MSKVEERVLAEIAGAVVCTSNVVKIKEHLLFYGKFTILCIEDGLAVDPVV